MKISATFSASICLFSGIYYLGFGFLLFFWPRFFWAQIAPMGPFNEHYARDVGSFFIPLGIGLLAAVRDLRKFRSVIVLAAVGSLLHAISHFENGAISPKAWIANVLLAAVAVLLFAALHSKEEESK